MMSAAATIVLPNLDSASLRLRQPVWKNWWGSHATASSCRTSLLCVE